MEIQIRKAVPLDFRALSALKRTVWETTYRGIYPDCEDHSIPQVKFHFSIETVKTN